FVVHAEALGYVEASGLSAVRCRQLAQLADEVIMDEAQMQALLETHLPGLGPQQRKWILDATAVAAYHAAVAVPVVRLLVCDDAPQFTLITEELALCWVHEAELPPQSKALEVSEVAVFTEEYVQTAVFS